MLAVFITQQTTTAFLKLRNYGKAHFADRAQNTDDHVDVADVKHGHYEVNSTKVARTSSDILPTSLAILGF